VPGFSPPAKAAGRLQAYALSQLTDYRLIIGRLFPRWSLLRLELQWGSPSNFFRNLSSNKSYILSWSFSAASTRFVSPFFQKFPHWYQWEFHHPG